MIAADFNGINSGVFFIKNCEWSYQFLINVYSRTDCISAIWPEQIAIASELQKPTFGSLAKIFPQRVFNSYPEELFHRSPVCTYQPGDFLIHFASLHGDFLFHLFDRYSKLVINDRNLPTLAQYLDYYEYRLSSTDFENNKKYMNEEKKDHYKECLAKYPHIKSILEIGLNGGHLAENYFQS